MADKRLKFSAAEERESRSGMVRNRFGTLVWQMASVTALKLVYDDGDLRIQGLDRVGALVVELRFSDVLLTRITPEGVRLRLLAELGATRGLVLTDERSELIPWVFDEGLNSRDMRLAKHFLVFIGEEIVDVVSLSEPTVTKAEAP
jgi:hypothetical protein